MEAQVLLALLVGERPFHASFRELQQMGRVSADLALIDERRAIETAASNDCAVGGEGHRVHEVLMSAKDGDGPSRARLPDAYGTVVTRGGGKSSSGVERHRRHVARVPAKHGHNLACSNVPDANLRSFPTA